MAAPSSFASVEDQLRHLSNVAHEARARGDYAAAAAAEAEYKRIVATQAGQAAAANVHAQGQAQVNRMRPAHASQSYQFSPASDVGRAFSSAWNSFRAGGGASGPGASYTPAPASTAPVTQVSAGTRQGVEQANNRADRGMAQYGQLLRAIQNEAGNNFQIGQDFAQGNADQLRGESTQLISDTQRGINELYQSAFDEIRGLEIDPERIYQRMAAQALLQNSGTARTAGQRRTAGFESRQGNAIIQAQAEEQAFQNAQRRADLFLRATEGLSDEQRQSMQASLAVADRIFTQNADMAKLGQQLDQADRALLGGIARDMQQIFLQNQLEWQKLSVDEQINRLELEMRRYGIDKDFESVMAQIDAQGRVTQKDWLRAAFGVLNTAAAASLGGA